MNKTSKVNGSSGSKWVFFILFLCFISVVAFASAYQQGYSVKKKPNQTHLQNGLSFADKIAALTIVTCTLLLFSKKARKKPSELFTKYINYREKSPSYLKTVINRRESRSSGFTGSDFTENLKEIARLKDKFLKNTGTSYQDSIPTTYEKISHFIKTLW